MSSAARYRKFLKLIEEWPLDKLKVDRDLGKVIRTQIAEAFKQGENTKIVSTEECDRFYESLACINSNRYKNMYPRTVNNCVSQLDLEKLRSVTSTDAAIKEFGFKQPD